MLHPYFGIHQKSHLKEITIANQGLIIALLDYVFHILRSIS